MLFTCADKLQELYVKKTENKMFLLCFHYRVDAKHFHSANYPKCSRTNNSRERAAGMRLFVHVKCPALPDFDHKHSATSDLCEAPENQISRGKKMKWCLVCIIEFCSV